MIEKNYICPMMKKFASSVFCVFALVCVASLCACSDPEAEAEINRIAIRNEALTRTVDSLRDEVDILKAQSDSVKNTLKSLDMHK